jgi:hypothetical protein
VGRALPTLETTGWPQSPPTAVGIVKERGGSQQNILRRVRRALFGGLGYSLPALE